MTLVTSAPVKALAGRFAVRDALRHISDDALRESTISFFDEMRALVEQEQIEYVIMAARRLTCLYLMLLRNGLPPLGARVVSDRDFAEFESQNFHGKSVLVLDDTVVLGSTISQLVNIVQLGAPAAIYVRAICRDEDQVSQNVWEEVGASAAVSASSVRVSKYSRDLARTLYLNEIPYFSDFPMTGPLSFDLLGLESVLAMDGWFAADVTASELTDGDVSAYSLVPRESLHDEIVRLLGTYSPTTSEFGSLFKVRLFVRRSGYHVSVRAVPIAVLAPMDEISLRRAVEEISAAAPRATQMRLRSMPLRAVQRWLQLVASMLVLDTFSLHARNGQARLIDLQDLDQGALVLDFGEFLANTASDIVRRGGHASMGSALDAPRQARPVEPSIALRDVRAATRELVERLGFPSEPGAGAVVLMGQDVVGPVAHSFSFLDGVYERPQRALLKNMSRAELDRRERELTRGISFVEIVNLIAGEGRGQWGKALASFALDVCNDVGVAVPMTVEVDGVVSREFRLGENAYLAGFPFGREGSYRSDPRRIVDETPEDVKSWLVPRLRSVVDGAASLGHAQDLGKVEMRWLREYGTSLKRAVAVALDKN